jgi:site-specific recombinase XerD
MGVPRAVRNNACTPTDAALSARYSCRQRRVPINAKARRCLHEYLEERAAPVGVQALFVTARGSPMSAYAVWYTVKKYAAQAGLENVTTHSFRHTVGTRLVRDPHVDLVTAAAFLGHARLDTTARYSQPNDDDLTRAAERV